MCRHREQGYRLQNDITLARESTDEWYGDTPSTVTYKKDGRKVLSWQEQGLVTHVAVYDKDGDLAEQMRLTRKGAEVVPPEQGLLRGVEMSLYSRQERFLKGNDRNLLLVFENSLIDDHMADENGYVHFDYDDEKCRILAASDGSFNIENKETGRLDNSNMAAFREYGKGPEGDQYFLHGELVAYDRFAKECGPSYIFPRGQDHLEGDPNYDPSHPDYGKTSEEIYEEWYQGLSDADREAYDAGELEQEMTP
jgi:hypothetical protein